MHILFIAEDTSGFISKNYYYLEKELSKNIDLTVWRKSGHIQYILKQIDKKPDFILLLNDMDRNMTPMIKGLGNIDIPTGLFVNDVHRFVKLRKNYIEKNKINFLFSVTRDQFIEIYPEYKERIEWFPHFVHTNIFKDYGMAKDINLLMMGAINDYYPFRQKLLKAYEGDSNFTYHGHPGYRNFSKEEEEQLYIGEQYAREINRAKIMFTCPSKLNYPVLKYFEALACKTLLLAPTFKELEDLGFIPNFHFIPVDEVNVKEKAAYYLENEKERERIAEQGYHFIRQNHTVEGRTKQLVEKISSLIRK
ncbi:glycosyltransferase [Aquibacillus kalidii]|uniref:glycosyltransferase n=1 Tax=Aquibacillus kalidii TaxID=2762597 RepID=UPI0016481A96|nr:glycosyltransferase [Aquibacillus kalidii]